MDTRINKFRKKMIFIIVTAMLTVFPTLCFAETNPFIKVITDLIGEIKGWLLGLVGVVTVVVAVSHGLGYQAATTDEKNEKIKSIKKTIGMGAGIFIIAWFALYVVGKFQAVK